FAGERIQCLLCGRWFRKIGGPHLTRIHGVTGDEYRKRFSLPPGRPLTGSGRDKKWSAARKWRRGDFKKILTRMRVQRRSLTDVCRDPDLPSFSSWRKYIKHRPEFSERLEALYSKLPFRLQGRAGRLSDQFGEECDRLRRQGMPYEKIAKTLGVTEKPVARALNEFDEKRGLDLRRKPIKLGPRKYQAILDRMIAQQRSMMDVCKDPDLPSYGAWLAYTKTRPEMRAEAKRILYSLPYPVQLATRDLSPRFLVDSLRLRAKGMNRREIADALGSCASVVSRRFKLHFQKKARMKKTDLERLKAEGEKPVKPPRKWKRKDYQRVLQRMRTQKRALGDVCKDPDLPTTGACTAYTKRHPEFARKVEAIYEKMPFSVQKRARKLSPGFRAECERLRG
ncbi:MAG: MucR family transcriptional regulator, partial [Desulfobacterales bacterium]|nr:MucR family transcriptional regulator [Desulfobacterales bacterium]